jgi:ATP-dependent protease Clp ATPase subunit
MAKWSKLRCSFCKKTGAEVAKLVAGPGVHICDECVAVASRLMEAPPPQGPAPEHRSLSRHFAAVVRRLLRAGDSQVPSAPIG